MEFSSAFSFALISSLLAALLIVLTQRFHGHLSLDSHPGVQKLHLVPTPRVGGVALVFGGIVGGINLPADAQWLWLMICLSSLPAFIFGLMEDVTKRVSVKVRLLATICAGMVFCMLTGYQITRVEILGVDWLLSFGLFSFVFTAFAIGGIANAINIIDGVNGLAAGTSIIILSGFAALAWQAGDMEIMGACLVGIGALTGFFLLNFPTGRLFMGDAGAYTTGFILAVIAVALPQRNAEISPLIGLLALAYPVIETMVSILRRMARSGSHPGQPDRLHLHSLVYRSRAKRLARAVGSPHLRNALTGLLMMGLPLMSVALMVMVYDTTGLVWASMGLMTLVYVIIYRKVALLSPIIRLAGRGPARSKQKDA
jgi:UDP-N-acetylmuramyl pentapeptide phosphotransferase/UDP-N-acetylglucosamine-1-phosphate transferase